MYFSLYVSLTLPRYYLNDFYTQGDDPIGPEDYEDEDDSKPEQLYGAPPGGDDQSEYSPPG